MFLDENEKLADKWEGPYLVTKVFPNGSVDILRKGRTVRVNKNRLNLYTGLGKTGGIDLPKQHVDARPSHQQKFLTPQTPAEEDDNDNESVVEVYSYSRIEYPPSPLHPFEEYPDDVVDSTNILLPSSSSNSSIASSHSQRSVDLWWLYPLLPVGYRLWR